VGNNIYTGQYQVKAEAFGYYSEYYDNVTSSATATPVTVTAPNDTPDINFTLSVQTLDISDVSAGNITETTATITWTTGEAATSQVEYGLAAGDYPLLTTENTTPVANHSVDLTGLTAGTTYHYRVISRNALDLQGRSADNQFTTPDLTAPVISAVSASVTGETTATITWTTNEPATSEVEYGTSTPGYGSTTYLDTNLVTSHSMDLTGLTSNTTYHYMVKSRDASTNWDYSEDYTFTTLDITAPVISQVSATNITTTGATITWTTGEAATSQVEYGPTASYGSATTIDTNLVTGHSVSLTGLTAGTTYHYRVKSTDASSNEAISADFTFTTATVPAPDTTPPTTPVVTDDGDSTTDLTQLHATWTSSDPESEIVEYQYAIGTSAGGNDVVDWTSMGTDTGVTKTGLNLSIGTTYYFSVKAQNSQGLWSDIGTSDGIQVEEVPPEQPSDGGGFPVWAWVIIGIAGGAAVGGLAYWLVRGMPKQPEQQS
jgi:phosphodiesterase/alkaline phosphatase D-like protein